MAPYSLSACQVVRVFCAVMRALGASPIMSLGIVFLTGYPTVKLLCNAISLTLFSSLLLNFGPVCSPPAPSSFLRAALLLKDFFEFRRAPARPAATSHTQNNHGETAVPCAYHATAGS
eukprot:scaffold19917_cov205-Skeletonema_dohrnii-CCMP3373.AAC.1